MLYFVPTNKGGKKQNRSYR